jgi:GH25 family lysozyme M1 (1,4-beta-N-acetylmuramidase)
MLNTFRNFLVSTFLPKHRAQGLDGSHWWGTFNPDKVTRPIDFMILKATEGKTFLDNRFKENILNAWKIPIRGAYHYQRANVSWIAQAEFHLQTIAAHDLHILALDVEKIGNEIAFSDRSVGDTFFGDMRRIIDYWRFKTSGKTIVLYTNIDIYQTYIVPAMQRLYGIGGIDWPATTGRDQTATRPCPRDAPIHG